MSENDDFLGAAPTSLQDLIDNDLDGLLETPEKPRKITSSDRLERAFMEIVEFRRTRERLPSSATQDIAERKLGARLNGILANDEKIAALRHLDTDYELLAVEAAPESLGALLESDDLDDLLGDASGILDVSDLPVIKRPESPDSVAKRVKAEDFERFEGSSHLRV